MGIDYRVSSSVGWYKTSPTNIVKSLPSSAKAMTESMFAKNAPRHIIGGALKEISSTIAD